MKRKSSRELFLEIVNAHVQLKNEKKPFDPEMVMVAEKIKDGRLQLIDMAYTSIKYAGDKATIHMFETQDAKETGITNVTQAKLQKDRLFLPTAITLLAAAFNGDLPNSDREWKSLKLKSIYDSIKKIPGLPQGDVTFTANKKLILDERPMQEFVTDNNHQVNLGTYQIDNPRFVKDDIEFEFTIEVGEDLPEKVLIKVDLNGTGTAPA